MATPTQRVVRRLRSRYERTVHDHKRWGSKRRGTYALRRRIKPAKVPCATVFQHITVTADTGPLTGDLFVDARTVERIGSERFGSGMSYTWLVDMRSGEIVVGQPVDAKGTHTVNTKGVPGYSYDQNYHARAIAVLGMPGDKLSDAAAESIACILAAMVDEGILVPDFDYKPHSFVAAKDCPCDPTRNRMDTIRVRVRELLTKDTTPPKRPRRTTLVEKIRGQLATVIQRAHESNSDRRRKRAKAALDSLPPR